jgi:hypothetical protein
VRIFPTYSIYPVNLKKNDCGSCVLVCADKDVRGLSSDKLQKKISSTEIAWGLHWGLLYLEDLAEM